MFKTTVSSTLRNQDAMDILFKNFFNNDSFFAPVIETKIGHPVDIYENDQGLHFEIAGSGLTKDDISITIEGDCLKIAHQKTEDVDSDFESRKYLHKGISRKSFNLGYRIAPKFNLSKADAQMTNGLLTITIPFAEEAKPKSLAIK